MPDSTDPTNPLDDLVEHVKSIMNESEQAEFDELMEQIEIASIFAMLQDPPTQLNISDTVLRGLIEYFRIVLMSVKETVDAQRPGRESDLTSFAIVAGLVFGHRLAKRSE